MQKLLLAGALIIALASALFGTGCRHRYHVSKHYDPSKRKDGLTHVDRTGARSLFGSSESATLQGGYSYAERRAGQTNVTHTVHFGTTGEKRGVDAEGLRAAGGAVAEGVGKAAEKILKR